VPISDLSHKQTRKAALRTTLWLISMTWLCGFAFADVKAGWQEGVPRNQSFTRVLIVGVTPDRNQRCHFELSLASEINSKTHQAIVSCDAMESDGKLTRENIDLAIASAHADAVLATTLVSADLGTGEGGGRDTRGSGKDYGPVAVYGAYGMPVIYGQFLTTPTITTIKGDVHVTSKFYQTRDATLIYTMDTKVRFDDMQDTAYNMATVATPIAKQLRRDGLIR
jgi:hypothetical protein